MRRRLISQSHLTKDQLENLFVIIESADELARDTPDRAISADARYLLADLLRELEDAMLERGLPLITAAQMADHIPMVDIIQTDDDEDTALAAMYNDDGLLTIPSDVWGNFADHLFDESAPPADDEDEATAS